MTSPLSDLRATLLVPVYAFLLWVVVAHYTSLAGQRKQGLPPYTPGSFTRSGR